MPNNNKKNSRQLNAEIDEVLQARKRREAKAPSPRQSTSSIPSQAEYERREIALAHSELERIRRQPLTDRKEAQASFLETMKEQPDLIGERLGWLLDGNYGYGPMLLAKQVLGRPRMNRVAALTQMVGAFEWRVPEDLTRAAWKRLSKSEQLQLERAVQAAIDEASREE